MLSDLTWASPIVTSSFSLTDEQLALDFQRGSRLALQTLVERYHAPLLGFLYRIAGGDRLLADDLVQETFLRFMRGVRYYHYARSFKTYLYAIAVNVARDHFKRADTRYTESFPADENWQAETASPLAQVIAADESTQVAAAVAALPWHQRETLILRYYQDLSLEEISVTLQIPLGTVKSRLSLGLKCLTHLLKDRL